MEYIKIDSNISEDFVDLVLNAVSVRKLLLKGFEIQCRGMYKDKQVGFNLTIKSNLFGIQNNDPKTWTVDKKAISLTSIGELSNNFINALSELYGFENKNAKMQSPIFIEAGLLQGDSCNILKEVIKSKCFLNAHENTHLYSEFYINFNIPQNIIEINEKDPEYRNNIVNSLQINNDT